MKELKQIKLLKQLEEGYVTFDNSGSDIVATDVKEAIKEVNEKVKKIDVTVEANEVNYTDNKGLGATNAQEAIDKLKEYTDTQDNSILEQAKQYANEKINAIDLIDIQVLATLPPSGETDILYMIGDVNTTDIFELYIWENNKFIKVGSTTIDLSQYALKSELPKNLSELINDTNFITLNDIIDDNSSATNKTYSSNKIDQLLQTVQPVSNAQDVSYDDSTTNLGATNVQGVIKILDTNIKNVNVGITLANNEW